MVVGAGVSLAATGGSQLAGWRGLLEDGVSRCAQLVPGLPADWAERLRTELASDDIDDILSAAQKIESKLKRIGEFGRWLIDTVGQLQVRNGAVIDALCELNIPILTTNYDGLIEKRAGVSPVTWRQPNLYEGVIRGDHSGIVHLHGFYEDPDSVVLGVSSYEAVLHDGFAQAMQRAIRSLNSILYVGYGKGLEDPNFCALRDWSTTIFGGSRYRHYRLAVSRDLADIQGAHSATERIFALTYGDSHEDLAPFLRSLASADADSAASSNMARTAAQVASADVGGMQTKHIDSYIAAVKAAHGHIKFVELSTYEDTPDIEIDKLYVEPSVAREQILADRAEAHWPRRTDIGTVLAKHQRVVVLGDPGYGKSTLTSCVSWRLCNSGHSVPVPMIVRELQLKADLSWEGLLDAFMQHRIGKLLRSRDTLEALLRDGRAVILLDGLDEIGNLLIRKKLRDAVHGGISQYPSVRWILTSRIVGYDQVPFHMFGTDGSKSGTMLEDVKADSVATVLYLAPFNTTQIREFAKKWYQRHESDANLALERAEAFVEAVNDNAGTKKLARVPYLLALMALIHRKESRLPHGRTDLYDRISAAYLETIDVARELDQVPYSLAQKKRWLAEVGFRMQSRRAKRAKGSRAKQADMLARKDEVCGWLSKAMEESGSERPVEDANIMLDYFASRSGLLVPRGEGVFAFMHLSIQEYFAACYLESRLTASRFAKTRRRTPSDDQLRRWVRQNEWLEVYILLFELLAKKDSKDTEEFFAFLFEGRATNSTPAETESSVRLLAEVVVDPYVVLSASTRRSGRRMCWRALFSTDARGVSARKGAKVGQGIIQLLLAECGGDLQKAWDAAGFSAKELKESARRLDCTACREISDIAPLAVLTKLESLVLTGCGKVGDLSPLSELSRLVTLSLDGCGDIGNLGALSALVELRALNISGCRCSSGLFPLASLSNLRHLALPECTTFDALLPVASMPRLYELGIDNLVAPVNFAYVLKCTSLTSLIIDGSSMTQDLSPLAEHQSLQEVHLHNFPSDVDLRPFVGSRTVKVLCLAGTEPEVIPPEIEQRVARASRGRKTGWRVRS